MRRFAPATSAPDPVGLPGSIGERFRLTMLPHLDAAYSFARYLARDAGAADDIVQDSYLRAYRSFASYRGDADRAWLFAIVRNCWRDWARGNRPVEAPIEVEELADDVTPETILLRHGAIASVRQAIEALPEHFREVIVLRELEEMSYRDIAASIDAPIGTVMSRLARGRQLLAALLNAADGAGEACA